MHKELAEAEAQRFYNFAHACFDGNCEHMERMLGLSPHHAAINVHANLMARMLITAAENPEWAVAWRSVLLGYLGDPDEGQADFAEMLPLTNEMRGMERAERQWVKRPLDVSSVLRNLGICPECHVVTDSCRCGG